VAYQEKSSGGLIPRRIAAGKAALSILAAVLLAACADSSSPTLGAGATQVGAASSGDPQDATRQRLAELRAQRASDQFAPSFYLGPGDVIEVSVSDVPELRQQMVRVSPEQTIELPVAGVVHVEGMTEEGLGTALRKRLDKYIKDPDVDVFVKEYHSRQVAVMGMVQKPGFYTLMSRSETLLEILGRAGGMNENASAQVIVVTASSGGQGSSLSRRLFASDPENAASFGGERAGASDTAPAAFREQPQRDRAVQAKKDGAPEQEASQTMLTTLLQQSDPIAIDLSSAANQSLLDIPARPGDAIIVPAAGEVMVDGWVQNPGAYKIVAGMSAVSAVAAAGGALFSSSALVLRTDRSGRKAAIPVDLSKVKSGTASDVPVQAGDVVLVQRSMVGAVPYAMYELFTKFGTGMYMPVP
jgi:polysaccharide biosynthesis/export protein